MHEIVVSVLLTAHLLSVNIVSAAPLFSIWHEWKEYRGDLDAGRAGRALLLFAIIGTFIGAVLGLIVGWLRWDHGLSSAVQRVPSKIHYAVWEILFSLVLTIVQLLWWRAAPRATWGQRAIRTFLALLSGSNLVYHFPVLFAVLTEMIHRGELSGAVINASGFRSEIIRGAVLARAVHFFFAAWSTCGVALMLYAHSTRSKIPDERRPQVAAWGARWALGATLAQIPTGLWLITRLSTAAQNRLMGGDLLGTSMFGLAFLASLWLAHVLASIAFGEASRRLVYRGAFLFIVVVWLMSGASRRALAPISVGHVQHEIGQDRSIA